MKKRYLALLLPLLLTSCNEDVEVSERPKDYNMDYWIYQVIDPNLLDLTRIYEETETSVSYLDSNYSLSLDEENKKVLPETRVFYTINFFEAFKWYRVAQVEITDPEVSVYGFTLRSNKYKIIRILKTKGFIEVENHPTFNGILYRFGNFTFNYTGTAFYINYFSNDTIATLF